MKVDYFILIYQEFHTIIKNIRSALGVQAYSTILHQKSQPGWDFNFIDSGNYLVLRFSIIS